jgi:hypothetical protein
LPLICDTNAGAESHPGLALPRQHFQHPEDAREQIVRGLKLHEEVFGVRPRGMWPSEGSVSNDVLAIAHECGIQWMASDEGVLCRSLNAPLHRDNAGVLDSDSAGKLYRIYRWNQGEAVMNLLFRDHSLSDLIGFVYSGVPAKEAAEDFIRRIKTAAAPLLQQGSDAVVPIILDGENAWEYYPKSGREFLRRLYSAIQNDSIFETLTVSEVLRREKSAAMMGSIAPGSWINANFDIWIGAPEDNLAWDHLSAARDFFSENSGAVSPSQRELAFQELLIAEGSDWNWWYGPEHHSANDRDFDELYRKHLSNVYHALGAEPPDALAQPIVGAYGKPQFTPQTAYISPRLESATPGYFDWLGAAIYVADRRAAAMHGKTFLLDTGYAGIDEQNLYCRLDFMEKLEEWGTPDSRLVVSIESGDGSAAGEERRKAYKLEVLFSAAGIGDWNFSENGTRAGKPGNITVVLRRESILECKVPLAALQSPVGTSLRVRFSLWRGQLPLDALPQEGAIEIQIASEDALGALAYAKP